MEPIQKIGVVGAGTMGSGIAQVAAVSGFSVQVCDAVSGQLKRSHESISGSLERFVTRGKMSSADRDAGLARIQFGGEISAVRECDFVIEAIVENVDAKRAVHSQLGRITRPEIILATNTSSISITTLSHASGRPAQFVGMHFFNPVPVMSLVEVIRGDQTSPITLDVTEMLARRMGKTPVRVNDAPGFVANRVLMPMINEAIHALAQGICDAEGIDRVMVLGCNHPMGPLALADLIGLDVCLFIM